MIAYVLCGGFGTRLRSVIGETQKALVEVQGQPFLARVLQQLKLAGAGEVVLCAHYRADQLTAQLDALAADSGLSLHMVVEAEPLGTGGALLNALHHHPPTQGYIVLNADTWLDAAAYRLALQAQGDLLVAVRVEDRARYGGLEVDAQGSLVALLEKGLTGPGLINAGVYAFTADAFAKEPIRARSLERELLPTLLKSSQVSVAEYTGRFVDIGTPESLAEFAEHAS